MNHSLEKLKLRSDDLVIRYENFGALIHDVKFGLIHFLNKSGSKIIYRLQNNLPINSDKNTEYFISVLTEKGLLERKSQTQIKPSKNSFFSPEIYVSDILKNKTLSAPIILYWEVTSKCNLKCKHCYLGNTTKSYLQELSTEEAMEFCKQIIKNKIFWVAITGGEPLLRSDLFDIVSYLTENQICVMLSTNGTLVTERTAKMLKNAGVRSVQVSIDGANHFTHDKIRGVRGSFHKAIKAVKTFIKVGIPDVTIASVATKLNYTEIPKIIDLAVKLRASRYRIINLMLEGNARKNTSELLLDTYEKMNLVKSVKNKLLKCKGKILVQQEDKPTMFYSFKNKERKKSSRIFIGCAAGRTICKVSSDGWVSPCSYFVTKEMLAGNIRKLSLEEIWKHSKVFRLFRNLKFIRGKCAKCKFLHICGGGCRAAAYTYYRDIHAEDPTCWYKE
jgi:radical SAM protein with 4Fe4S-binding SPASM domain